METLMLDQHLRVTTVARSVPCASPGPIARIWRASGTTIAFGSSHPLGSPAPRDGSWKARLGLPRSRSEEGRKELMTRAHKLFGLVPCAALLLGIWGCSDTAGVEQTTKIKGPEGSTTITKKTEVESRGENPPIPVDRTAPPPSNPNP